MVLLIKTDMGYHNNAGKNGFVYILANYNRTVLYIGMTNNLVNRIQKHRKGKGCFFTRKYKVKNLMYIESYPNINEAIAREKQLKNWHREWKFNLIKQKNPELKDLWNYMIR